MRPRHSHPRLGAVQGCSWSTRSRLRMARGSLPALETRTDSLTDYRFVYIAITLRSSRRSRISLAGRWGGCGHRRRPSVDLFDAAHRIVVGLRPSVKQLSSTEASAPRRAKDAGRVHLLFARPCGPRAREILARVYFAPVIRTPARSYDSSRSAAKRGFERLARHP